MTIDRAASSRSGLLSGAIVLAIWACPTLVLAQEGPMLVEVDPVRIEPLNQTHPVLGRIVTRQRGEVASRVEGRVGLVKVDVGDRVQRGDPLVSLDAEPLDYAHDLAKAEHEAALAEQATTEAEIDLLENELARFERLANSAAFSQAQRDDKIQEIAVAKQRLATAAARINQYQAQLDLSARNLEDAVIKAPYAGVVTRRQVSPGAYVGIGDPVVTMIDDRSLEIEADISNDLVVGLEPGVNVLFRLSDRSEHQAKVRAIVPEENPLTRTRAVRLTPDFKEMDDLAVAQSVTLDIPIGRQREVITVSKDGIIRRADGAIVFLVEDEAAAARPVDLGGAVGGRFEVQGGLNEGDLVVVRGNERLRPGQAITYPGAPAAVDTTGDAPPREG